MKTKNLLYTALIFIFSANSLCAQEKFSVPIVTDNQKLERMNFMTNVFIIIGADYAKSKGQSIEDYARYVGERVKTTWDINSGFSGFVNGSLYNLESIRSSTSPPIEFIKQTDNFVQFKAPLDMKKMMGENKIFDISFKELVMVYEITFKIVAEHLGVKYQQKLIENGAWIEITITK